MADNTISDVEGALKKNAECRSANKRKMMREETHNVNNERKPSIKMRGIPEEETEKLPSMM